MAAVSHGRNYAVIGQNPNIPFWDEGLAGSLESVKGRKRIPACSFELRPPLGLAQIGLNSAATRIAAIGRNPDIPNVCFGSKADTSRRAWTISR